MPIANFDADEVDYRAYQLWEEDLNNGNFDYEEFYDFLLKKEYITDDQYDNLEDASEDFLQSISDKYEDEFIEDVLKDDIPDSYIERAADDCRDEAEEHGYSARFI